MTNSPDTIISCSQEAINGLHPEVLQAFTKVARRYYQAEGEPLQVTSGRRTLKQMAFLMADFTTQQLEGMYCRNGYPDYILSIAQARESHGEVPLTGDEIYAILQHRKEGYISRHLFGGAIDIATEGLRNKALLCALLQEAGFTTLDETHLGIACIHASLPQIPKEIIRE